MKLLFAVILCLVFGSLTSGAEDGGRSVVHPEDTGEALENPGMGWVFHYYDNVPKNYGSRLEPSDTLDDFPGLTCIYLRIPWSYIEPEEGEFRWQVVDTPAQRWIEEGKQIAFRFSCSESWMRYATPQWVEDAGAQGYNFRPGDGVTEDGPFWEPDFDDAIFLEKLDHFLAAAAERYDGNPQVAFIDVGSFGVWGEGHTWSSTRLEYSAETIKKHIDLYRKHFRHTLLAANDDLAGQGRGREVIEYAAEHGLTLRDDSILVQGGDNAYFNADMAPMFRPNVPVVLESEHYGGSRDRGNWQDGGKYIEAIEEYHASYASIHWWPREFLNENRDLIQRINQRLGYRLQLTDASWDSQVRLGGALEFRSQWRNAGVAPCLPGGYVAMTLKDAKGGITAVFVDDGFDVGQLSVGPPGEAEVAVQKRRFALPFNMIGGEYDVYVSVGTKTGTPRIALPLTDGDGRRRYRLGKLQIIGDYDLQVRDLERQDEGWVLPVTWEVHAELPAGVVPFCHFTRGGEIAFQGLPQEPRPEEFGQAGTGEFGCEFAVPESAYGRRFAVKLGLWVPERIGQPDERLVPDRGAADRRVTVGTLEVGGDGSVRFDRGGDQR